MSAIIDVLIGIAAAALIVAVLAACGAWKLPKHWDGEGE